MSLENYFQTLKGGSYFIPSNSNCGWINQLYILFENSIPSQPNRFVFENIEKQSWHEKWKKNLYLLVKYKKMRLKATVETLNRDVIMKTKPAYSLISLGKKPPAKDNPNEDPKVYSER